MVKTSKANLLPSAIRSSSTSERPASRLGAVVSVRKQGRCPRTLGVGPRQGWELLPECARTSAFATAHRAVPARAPFPSAPVSATAVLPQRMRLFIRAFISAHAAWNLCSPAAFRLRNQQQQSSNVDVSQTLGSGRSGTEPPREEIACAGPPAVAELPRPQRGGAHTLAGASSRQLCRYYGVPKRDRRRHRRSGELRAQSCECFKKQTTLHFTSSHHVTPCTQPSLFLTLSQCNFLQTRVACFFRCASCQLRASPPHFRGARSLQGKCHERTNSTAQTPSH